MKEDLILLFEDTKTKSTYGTINERVDSRNFIIEDDKETLIKVRSTQEWSIGARVLVQNGLIAGPGKQPSTYIVYSV